MEPTLPRSVSAYPAPPWQLPPRDPSAHKGNFGRVLLVGGSRGMAGSIALASISALRCGSGLVTAAIPDCCLETVAGYHPCVMTIPLQDSIYPRAARQPSATHPRGGEFGPAAAAQLRSRLAPYDAIAVGPGMGTGFGSQAVVNLLRSSEQPRVVDADALNCLANNCLANSQQSLSGPCILTPHPGEWQRLSDVSARDRLGQCAAAKAYAKSHECVVLLKGSSTFITDGTHDYVNPTGNPGMATGGSGDCLTGILVSLLGCGYEPWRAACLGAWIHGCAGDLAAARHGMAGMTASEIVAELPQAVEMASVTPQSGPIPTSVQSS